MVPAAGKILYTIIIALFIIRHINLACIRYFVNSLEKTLQSVAAVSGHMQLIIGLDLVHCVIPVEEIIPTKATIKGIDMTQNIAMAMG